MIIDAFRNFACTLSPGAGGMNFIPTWYQYLDGKQDVTGKCVPDVVIPDDAVLILLAVVDMLMTVGGLVAIGFVIYGGVKYITSQGEPDKTKDALHTIINALIGLAIVLVAASIVSFIAGRLS